MKKIASFCKKLMRSEKITIDNKKIKLKKKFYFYLNINNYRKLFKNKNINYKKNNISHFLRIIFVNINILYYIILYYIILYYII